MVVLWDTGSAPPHAVGRGSTAPTPRQVNSMDIERPCLLRPNPVARGLRAFRPVEYQPTNHRARAAQYGLDVVVLWAGTGSAPPYAADRGSIAPTLRQVDGTDFGRPTTSRPNPEVRGPRAFRPVEYRPTAHSAPAAQYGLGVVVLWANTGSAPPYAVGRGSTAPTPRLVDSTDAEQLCPSRPNPVARSPRAFCLVEFLPTAHRAPAA